MRFKELLAAVGKPLVQITLGDLQGYFSTLELLSPSSRPRRETQRLGLLPPWSI